MYVIDSIDWTLIAIIFTKNDGPAFKLRLEIFFFSNNREGVVKHVNMRAIITHMDSKLGCSRFYSL